ncbi:MAG: hypothetical protein ABWX74_19685 [Aeromicrobium sp.]
MNTFTVRTIASAAVTALAFTTLAIPASASASTKLASSPTSVAADIDEDTLAGQICAPGTEAPDFYDVETVEYAERAEVNLYVYETSAAIDGDEETGALPVPSQLCVFAITSTDEDSTLDGSYTLSVTGTTGSAQGPVYGTESATTALGGTTELGQVAVFTATGQQTTIDVDKPSKSEKKSAAKKYKAAKKKAKKKYSKAGKTAKAKRKLAKELAGAKKKYKAAIATKKTTTKRPYSLRAELAIDREG